MEEQKEELKVATEVAESEFMRWLRDMDMDHKAMLDGMTQADVSSFNKAKRTIIRAMERGNLVYGDKGLVFTPQLVDTSPIVFPEPSGDALLAQDKFEQGQSMAKMNAVLAALTGKPPARFAKMARRDSAVCEAIFGLFFG